MEFSPIEYGKMKWNISSVSKKGVLDTFGDLKEIFSEVKEHVDQITCLSADDFVKYIVYTYHKESPYARDIQDIVRRKFAILDYLGVKYKGNEDVLNLVRGRNQFCNIIAIHFCKFENSLDWMEYCMLLEFYISAQQAISDEDLGKSKIAAEAWTKRFEVKEKLTALKKDIDALAERLFKNDLNNTDWALTYMRKERNGLKIFPEDFVKDKREASVSEGGN